MRWRPLPPDGPTRFVVAGAEARAWESDGGLEADEEDAAAR